MKRIFLPSLIFLFTVSSSNGYAESLDELSHRLGLSSGQEDTFAKERQTLADDLEAFLKTAPTSHPRLRIAAARQGVANAQRGVAYRKLFPSLSSNATHSLSYNRDLDTSNTTDSRSTSFGLALNQNLYRGGQDLLDLEIAESTLEVSSLRNQKEQEQLVFEIKRAVITYNQAAMRLLLAKMSLQTALEIKDLSLRKRKAGLAGEVDLYQTDAGEIRAASGVEQAQQELNASRDVLDELLSSEPPSSSERVIDLTLKLTRVALPLPKSDSAIREATLHSEKQIALSSTREKELLLKKHTRSRWIPQLDFSASLSRSLNEGKNPLTEQRNKSSSQGTTFGLSLSWPIWTPTYAKEQEALLSQIQESKAEADLIDKNISSTKKRLERSITGFLNMQPLLLRSYKQSVKVFDAQRRLYQAGAVDIFALIDANTQRQTAIGAWYENNAKLQLVLLEKDIFERGILLKSVVQ